MVEDSFVVFLGVVVVVVVVRVVVVEESDDVVVTFGKVLLEVEVVHDVVPFCMYCDILKYNTQ